MLARSGFEELIETLFQIDGGRASHVVEIIALAIPRKRRTHRCAVARMVEVVRPCIAHLSCEDRRGVSEIRRVIVEKIPTILTSRAARESNSHPHDWLHCRSLHSYEPRSPFAERVRKRCA